MLKRITQEERLWLEQNSHLSILDIVKHTGRNKSTIQGWLKTIGVENRLAFEQVRKSTKIERMLKNVETKQLEALDRTQKLFDDNKSKHDFLAGIALYWAEGTKSGYTFTNSDPRMIIFMTHWIRTYLKPPTLYLRLHVLEKHKSEALEHWSNVLKGDLCSDIRISMTKPVKTEMGIMQINAIGLKDARLTIAKLIELYNNCLVEYVT